MTREEEIRSAGQRICWPSDSTIAFKKGAECADEHPKEGLVDLSQVWHNAKEEPEKGKLMIGIDEDGISIYKWVDQHDGDWLSFAIFNGLFKWAYIDDLLPKGGETWK